MNYNYVAIEGNIGSGKTTLAKMISNDFNARLILERFKDNSFLPKFYKDPEKYAFPLEMSFLADRFQQIKSEGSAPELFSSFTISDYFIDKSLIFAKNNLQKDEYILYSRLFEIINLSLPKPELIVYLYNSVENVLNNIKHRGRSYEQDIKFDYLDNIQKGYLDYFKHLTNSRILIIDTRNIDFVENRSDYKKLITAINKDFAKGIHRITFL
ncbi:MAG: deoxynucleoside kinase [Bacteroidales bacterium]|nr:deoxynucleoside kinase [Bacteroidales bacterium]MCF8405802.1 deoxynucleoside kinase [Bacteroidales bacterium]